MKLKGINPAEQHVEKIVLGLVALVLLAVLTMQFALPPKGVTVGSASDVPPEDALNPVLEEARATLARMNDQDPNLPDLSQQDLESAYRARVGEQTVPRERLAAMGPATNLGAFDVGAEIAGGVYALPTLPAPTAPVAAAYRGSVHPSEWAASQALRDMLGEDQPFDLGAVSVQAFIDGQSVRRALLTDADGDAGPTRPLPPSWWRSGFEVLGVQLERERRLSDGGWGERAVISGVPGRVDVLSDLQKLETNDPRLLIEMTRLAGSEIDQVTKPSFYRTIAGEDWRPPLQVATATESDNEEVNRLVRRAKGLDRDIQTLRDAIEGDAGRPSPGAREPSDRGGGGGKGGAGGRSGGREQPSPSSSQERADPREARLAGLIEQYEELETQLTDLGYTIDGESIEEGGYDEAVYGKLDRLLDNDRLAMWSHDVTAVGGETYRYRLRPVFNNPAFGRQQALSDEQQDLASAMTLPGPWSPWTEPVQALADEYYFVVNARESDRLGGGPQASVELYKFYYGFYRRATMSAEPGDQLAAEARVPEGLVIYDTSKLERLDELETRQPSQPDGGRRGIQTPDPREGGGRGRAPGGVAPPEDPRDSRRGVETQQSTTAALAELGEPALREIPISVQAVLVDVARVPGSGGQSEGELVESRDEFRAFLANSATGMISVRLPSLDEASAVYRAVEESWRAGQRAAAPDPAEEPERPTRPDRQDREPFRPRPSPGGGGSGGGGSG